MAEGEDDDKKHDPSEQSLRESAERGELPRSTELTAVVSLLAAVGAMVIASAEVTSPIQRFTYDLYDPSYRIDEGGALDLLQRGGRLLGLARVHDKEHELGRGGGCLGPSDALGLDGIG